MLMSKHSRFLTILFIIMLTAALLSGCSQNQSEKSPDTSQPAKADETIKIGTIGPLTGNIATYGLSTKNGVEIAVEEFNQNGGINGKPIKLISEDTRGEQTEAANAASKLIEQDKVVAIVGGVISSETLTAGPIANDAKVVMISSSSTAAGVPEIGDYIFRNCLSDEVQAIQLAEYAVKELGLKKFAIMFTNNDYGLSLKEAFEAKAKELAGITAIETYNDGEKDFRAQLTKIKGTNPDALYIAGYYTEAAKIAQQAKDQGLNVQILGADGFYSPVLLELGGDAVEGAVFTAGFFTDDPSENTQNFVKVYKEKFNSEPDMFAAQAYDATMILLTAIKNTDGKGGEALQQEMAKTKDFPGITGNTSFTDVGDAIKDIIILKVEDGKFTKLR
ncbi:Extracellular ligand-binding receptor [Tepidanaerobacter acetatoxydans Re1]|uniref:Extracellular ligand-binding receptor n=1 Tax=Tepidanaerobacter acetatoxydans (strain DSM 21804 / JCM 16047 / Re1) TaxID=1209989 RepID=F4LU65_TEPAE|nr:ABC transporter substrate-binding protein [Tepidanaerobacter acetatoxydans]AEE90591.1 Extracellular ligand-binding receptor [Tepidanaerobacter acetatoxydans Re1]CDI40374.1 Extracellular ligand-binding receptor [Tepidanaerobacter acetatoxydans Re1]